MCCAWTTYSLRAGKKDGFMGREESIPSASTNAVRVLYLGVGDSIQVPVPVLRYEVVRYKVWYPWYPISS